MFFRDKDRGIFLRYLSEACSDNDCRVHAFVLMTNHVHLLATGYSRGAISLMMRDVGRRYVQYVNAEYKRTGTLYEGRFKSSLVETRLYFLTCMRYIELNPVRARMVGEAYRRLFDEEISGDQLAAIRESVQKSRALGSETYCHALESTLTEPVRARPQGRPAKGQPVPFSTRKGT